MTRFSNLLVLTAFFTSSVAIAQIPTIQVVPSSPSSKALERYTDYPVSMFTGVPDISIPIYEIRSGDLVLPISISYHASGIKADDNSYPVGVGWCLNAGGRISRTIRDKADEKWPAVTQAQLDYFYTQPASYSEPTIGYMDSEPDIFLYNFGLQGKTSGRFVFDLQKRPANYQLSSPVFIPKANIRLDSFHPTDKTIGLTDNEGVYYTFGGNANGNKAFEYLDPSGSADVSAWLCREILPATKAEADKIAFSYQPGTAVMNSYNFCGKMELIDSIRPQSHVFTGTPEENTSTPTFIRTETDDWIFKSNLNHPNWQYTSQALIYDVTQLKTISFNGGKAEFVYGSNNLLQTITISNNQNQVLKAVQFYYSGFAGVSINDTDAPRIKLDSLVFKGESGSKNYSYKFDYLGAQAWGGELKGRDFWRYYNGQNMFSTEAIMPLWENVPAASFETEAEYSTESCALCPKVQVGSSYYIKKSVSIGNQQVNSWETAMKSFLLKKIILPTGGYTEYEFEANKYKDSNGTLVDVGGLRVKKIKSYTGDGSSLVKSYQYGVNGDGAGIPVNVPTYDDFMTTTYLYNGDPFNNVWARKRTFYNQPNQEIAFLDGSSVWYTYIEEYLENEVSGAKLGKTLYKYQIPVQNASGRIMIEGQEIGTKYLKLTNGFNFPNLVQKRIYKSDQTDYIPVSASHTGYQSFENSTLKYTPFFKILELVNWSYPSSEPRPNTVTNGESFISDMFYVPVADTSLTYTNGGLDSSMVQRTYDYNGIYPFPSSVTTHISGNEYKVTKTKYPLDFADYDVNNGYVANINGTDEFSQGIKKLIIDNAILNPIEETTELWRNNAKVGVLSGQVLGYLSSFPKLGYTYLTETNTPIASFSETALINGAVVMDPSYKERQKIEYNGDGRVISLQQNKGVTTTYLWSYKGEYPIAKIENADYNSVVEVLGEAQINSFKNNYNPSETDILNFIASLRTALPHAQVTTYTYKPLVGMTSMTDPAGRTTTYEYDTFQRLSTVRDQNGNVLKKTDYHYKP